MPIDPNFVEVNEVTDYWSFLMSIDWRDPWFIGLIVLHIVTTVTTLMTRNNTNFQIFLFLILCYEPHEPGVSLKRVINLHSAGRFSMSAVYFSESINEYAALNWRSFSKQQYFDSNGLFISTVFSIPILLNCMLLIGAWLYNSTQMMATLKVAQLKYKLRREQRLQQEASGDHLKQQ